MNGIFVDERYFERFAIADDSPAALRANLSQISWLFQTYDGRVRLAGQDRIRWHDAPLLERDLQVVPRPLRGFPPAFGPVRRRAWRAWRAWRQSRYS